MTPWNPPQAQPVLHALPVLWITRYEGQALTLSRCLNATDASATLADLLTQSGVRPDTDSLQELARCRFGAVGEQSAARLAFEHASKTLRCTHNGRALARGQLVWLEPGDVLEAGLCRCEIKDAGQDRKVAAAAGLGGTRPLPDLDLTVLAAARPQTQHLAPGALTDLLGQNLEFQANESSARPSAVPAREELAQVPPDKVLHPEAVADEPLRHLHEKYLRHLQSPYSDAGEASWTDLTRDGQQANADPFDAMMSKSEQGRSLDDMLGLGVRIDSVLAQLEQLGDTHILGPEPTHKLLHLFAPPSWREAQARLPQLSRQEHHGMALDSVLTLDVSELAPPRHPLDKP